MRRPCTFTTQGSQILPPRYDLPTSETCLTRYVQTGARLVWRGISFENCGPAGCGFRITERCSPFPDHGQFGNPPPPDCAARRCGPSAPEATPRNLVVGFKQRLREFRLPNDAPQGPTPDRIVERNRNCDCRSLQALLHDPVAALLPDCGESMLFENPANLRARKNPELTQPAPRPE